MSETGHRCRVRLSKGKTAPRRIDLEDARERRSPTHHSRVAADLGFARRDVAHRRRERRRRPGGTPGIVQGPCVAKGVARARSSKA